MLFGIGLSRTGTTTLGDAGEILGLRRLGWTTAVGPVDSHQLMKAWERGDIDALAKVASRYEVVEDLPWPLVYEQMAERFGDAKFVLTRRSNTSVWLRSIQEHTRNPYGMHAKVYGAASADESPTVYIDYYDRHLRDVRAFFALEPERLLEVCWDEGDGWPELCAFLGVPEPDVAFPHSNVAGSRVVRPRRPWVVREALRLKRWVKSGLS